LILQFHERRNELPRAEGREWTIKGHGGVKVGSWVVELLNFWKGLQNEPLKWFSPVYGGENYTDKTHYGNVRTVTS